MNGDRRLWMTVVGLGLIAAFGAWFRLTGLSAMSVCHPEMYVPGIRMPADLAEPQPRLTLVKTLTGTFSADTHPPGYYVLMLGWTKLFGTSIASIRLPSALFGILSIPLVFCLGALAGNRKAGWIAAALFAASGFHAFWSKVARMYSLDCFLGLLATVLLLGIAQGRGPRRILQLAYAASILLGLAVHIFFWPIFLTHIAWVLLNARASGQPLPGIARVQLLLLILASPLLAFAAYQSGNQLALMSRHVLLFAREYLTFGFLFPQAPVTDLFRTAGPPVYQGVIRIAAAILFVCALLLIAAALKTARRESGTVTDEPGGPSRKAWIAAGALGFIGIRIFVELAQVFARPEPYPTIKLTEVLSLLPLALAALAAALESNWRRLLAWGRPAWDNRLFIGRQALVWMLALLPFAAVAAISAVKPMLNQRGFVLTLPYLLLVLAAGVAAVMRSEWITVPAIAVLGASHILSLAVYREMAVDPTDLKAFSAALAAQTAPGDLILMHHNWSATPILYYLKEGKFKLIGRDYAAICKENPNARIWALSFGTSTLYPEIQEAVHAYQPAGSIEQGTAHAFLYRAGRP